MDQPCVEHQAVSYMTPNDITVLYNLLLILYKSLKPHTKAWYRSYKGDQAC